MTHTTREKTKLINRVRRICGQIDGVERMIAEEKGCAAVLQTVAGVRGAINGLMGEIIEDHLLHHVAAEGLTHEQRSEGAAELLEVIRAYLK